MGVMWTSGKLNSSVSRGEEDAPGYMERRDDKLTNRRKLSFFISVRFKTVLQRCSEVKTITFRDFNSLIYHCRYSFILYRFGFKKINNTDPREYRLIN